MDDPKLHGEDDSGNTAVADDSQNTVTDDGVETPASTEDNQSDDDSKKAEAAKAQKDSFLTKIRAGKMTVDEVPENLAWLKKDIEKDLDAEKGDKSDKKVERGLTREEAEAAANRVYDERSAGDNLETLISDIQDSEVTSEQDVEMELEYKDQLAGIDKPTDSQKYKALMTALRLVGIKSNVEAARARRRKGMALPTPGSKKRDTVKTKEGEPTALEKRMGEDLPPGFKIK